MTDDDYDEEKEEVAYILCLTQILQTQEKELAKLMFENRKMTDFMPLHCFGFEVSSCVQQP